MNRQEIETQLIDKAGADLTFRRRLLDDPKAAVADLLGVALPPGMTLTVLEEQPGRHYLVLPPAPPALDALPLADLELALVGGGRTLRPNSGNGNQDPTLRQAQGYRKYSNKSSC